MYHSISLLSALTDSTSMLVAFSSALDAEALCHHIAGVLPSSIGVNLIFGGIVGN